MPNKSHGFKKMIGRHLGGIWGATWKHLGVIREASDRHLLYVFGFAVLHSQSTMSAPVHPQTFSGTHAIQELHKPGLAKALANGIAAINSTNAMHGVSRSVLYSRTFDFADLSQLQYL